MSGTKRNFTGNQKALNNPDVVLKAKRSDKDAKTLKLEIEVDNGSPCVIKEFRFTSVVTKKKGRKPVVDVKFFYDIPADTVQDLYEVTYARNSGAVHTLKNISFIQNDRKYTIPGEFVYDTDRKKQISWSLLKWSAGLGIPTWYFLSWAPSQISAGTGNHCAITTAAWGNRNHPMVQTFIGWREECLKNHRLGKTFIGLYDRYAPAVADHIRGREGRMFAVRAALTPIAWGVRARLAVRRFAKDVKHSCDIL